MKPTMMPTLMAVTALLTVAVWSAGPALAKGVRCEYSKDRKYLKNGKHHGKVPCLSESGQLMQETTFVNGVEHGPFRILSSEGTPRFSGTYKKGKRHGPYTVHLRDGRPHRVTTYRDGKEHGRYVEYCVRGKTDKQIKLEGNYKGGQIRDGKWKSYDCRSGLLAKVESWDRGLRDGEYVEYNFRSEKVARRYHFKANKRHGVAQRFDKEGKLAQQQCWQHGSVVKPMSACTR